MTIKKIYRRSLWIQFLLVFVMGMLVYNVFVYVEAVEDWMPDANLR